MGWACSYLACTSMSEKLRSYSSRPPRHRSLRQGIRMKRRQTAVPEATDNSVILYFLKALWSGRIMQSLPNDSDVQHSGSYWFTFCSDKINATAVWLGRCHKKKYKTGSEQPVEGSIRAAHTVSLCKLQLYRRPTIPNIPNLCVCPGAHKHAGKHADATKAHGARKNAAGCWFRNVRLPPFCFHFVSGLWDIFLCPSFMSSSAALTGSGDKDRGMNSKCVQRWSRI